MRCILCKQGDTHPGKTTVSLQRGNTTVIIKDVPAMICVNCGEYYLDEHVTQEVLRMAEHAAGNNVEIEILRFAA